MSNPEIIKDYDRRVNEFAQLIDDLNRRINELKEKLTRLDATHTAERDRWREYWKYVAMRDPAQRMPREAAALAASNDKGGGT